MSEVLTYDQMDELTERLNFVKDKILSSEELKYVQLNLLIELLTELLEQLEYHPNRDSHIKRIATLKVHKKNFEK